MTDQSGPLPLISETEPDTADGEQQPGDASGTTPQLSTDLPPRPPSTHQLARASASVSGSGAGAPGKTAGTSDEPPERAPWADSGSPAAQACACLRWKCLCRRITHACQGTTNGKCKCTGHGPSRQAEQQTRGLAAQQSLQSRCRWRRHEHRGQTAAAAARPCQVLRVAAGQQMLCQALRQNKEGSLAAAALLSKTHRQQAGCRQCHVTFTVLKFCWHALCSRARSERAAASAKPRRHVVTGAARQGRHGAAQRRPAPPLPRDAIRCQRWPERPVIKHMCCTIVPPRRQHLR